MSVAEMNSSGKIGDMRIWIFTLMLALSSPVQAGKTYGDVVVDRVGTVIDGDSFKVDINDWPEVAGKGITVRISDIDTPELWGKCGAEKQLARKAKQFTVDRLRSANKVELRNMQRGKYFRLVADVYVDGVSLGADLMRSGLAVEYGKRKRGWCKSPPE